MKWKIDEAEDLQLAIIEDAPDGEGVCEIGERNERNLLIAKQIKATPELINMLQEFLKPQSNVDRYETLCEKAKSLLESIYGMPIEVFQAIMHVRQFHPDVCMVVYGKDTRWHFMEEDFESVLFVDGIDVGILEDAQSAVEKFPAVFQL